MNLLLIKIVIITSIVLLILITIYGTKWFDRFQ